MQGMQDIQMKQKVSEVKKLGRSMNYENMTSYKQNILMKKVCLTAWTKKVNIIIAEFLKHFNLL